MNSMLKNFSELNLKGENNGGTSPPGKVEILQDLDLFYIKQLAHNYKEHDLEQRIAVEIKMREGSSNLLAACGAKGPQANQPQTLEAAKSLLTSNERMGAYMAELQRRRTVNRVRNESTIGCSTARVCLSDIRMPLMWKDIDHFKNKGDNRKFAVFVLVKIGTEIYDTVMVNPVDRSMTDICFDDVLLFNDIPANFDCSIEIYSHLLESEMTSLPRKIKKTLHSSISRTVGRKLAATLRDELATGELGPKFDLVASAKLKSENLSNNISTYDFILENTENPANQLPLFGHFCCRLAAHPNCYTNHRISGFAKVPESDSADSLWCRLLGWRIEVWHSKEEARKSLHHPLALSVDTWTEVTRTSECVLQVKNTRGIERGILTLLFSEGNEASNWLSVLTQHITDYQRWGKASEEEMEILTPQANRHQFNVPRRTRFASLYEEIPIADTSSSSSEKSSYDDLYDQSSYMTPYCSSATLGPRTRAFTLSSSRSSFRRWGSVRANMPFFKSKS